MNRIIGRLELLNVKFTASSISIDSIVVIVINKELNSLSIIQVIIRVRQIFPFPRSNISLALLSDLWDTFIIVTPDYRGSLFDLLNGLDSYGSCRKIGNKTS